MIELTYFIEFFHTVNFRFERDYVLENKLYKAYLACADMETFANGSNSGFGYDMAYLIALSKFNLIFDRKRHDCSVVRVVIFFDFAVCVFLDVLVRPSWLILI